MMATLTRRITGEEQRLAAPPSPPTAAKSSNNNPLTALDTCATKPEYIELFNRYKTTPTPASSLVLDDRVMQLPSAALNPAARYFQSGIHLICSFLSVHEMHRMAQCCRWYRDAVYADKSRDLTLNLRSQLEVSLLLKRTEKPTANNKNFQRATVVKGNASVSSDQLSTLLKLCSRVKNVDVRLSADTDNANRSSASSTPIVVSSTFPHISPRLQKLTFSTVPQYVYSGAPSYGMTEVDSRGLRASMSNLLMSVTTQAKALQELNISLKQAAQQYAMVDLSGLALLPQLTRLSIYWAKQASSYAVAAPDQRLAGETNPYRVLNDCKSLTYLNLDNGYVQINDLLTLRIPSLTEFEVSELDDFTMPRRAYLDELRDAFPNLKKLSTRYTHITDVVYERFPRVESLTVLSASIYTPTAPSSVAGEEPKEYRFLYSHNAQFKKKTIDRTFFTSLFRLSCLTDLTFHRRCWSRNKAFKYLFKYVPTLKSLCFQGEIVQCLSLLDTPYQHLERLHLKDTSMVGSNFSLLFKNKQCEQHLKSVTIEGKVFPCYSASKIVNRFDRHTVLPALEELRIVSVREIKANSDPECFVNFHWEASCPARCGREFFRVDANARPNEDPVNAEWFATIKKKAAEQAAAAAASVSSYSSSTSYTYPTYSTYPSYSSSSSAPAAQPAAASTSSSSSSSSSVSFYSNPYIGAYYNQLSSSSSSK